MPKISVIMPAYNAEKYIAEAIDSILGQTFEDFEFIILNDCSTDRTEEIILSYDDPRIVYLKNEQNMGVAATLNRGLEVAKGEYIARMDADDISLPERFALQLAYLDAHPQVAVCGSAIQPFDESHMLNARFYSSHHGQIAVDLLFNCALAHPTIMMRVNILRKIGISYEPQFVGCEDYRLWTRIVLFAPLSNLNKPLLYYRLHATQVTATSSSSQDNLLKKIRKEYLVSLGVSEAYVDFFTCIGHGMRCFLPEQLDEIYDVFLFLTNKLGLLTSSPRRVKQAFSQLFFSFSGASFVKHKKLVSLQILISAFKKYLLSFFKNSLRRPF